MSSSGWRNYQISTNHMPLFQVRQYKQAVCLQGHQDCLDRDYGADQLTGPGQRKGWQVPCVHQCEQRVHVVLTMTFTSRCARRRRTSARLWKRGMSSSALWTSELFSIVLSGIFFQQQCLYLILTNSSLETGVDAINVFTLKS